MPGVITALIFTFIAAWNEFVVALTLTTTPAKQPLTVALNSFIGQYQVDWQNLFAGSVIATIPVIILFALIERKGGRRPHRRPDPSPARSTRPLTPSGVAGNAGDAEDRLAERGPDETLDEARGRDHRAVVDLDQARVRVADAAPADRGPPGDAAQEVDRLEHLDVEARLGDRGAQGLGGVALDVADLAVEVAVQLHVAGHPDDDPAAGHA